MNLISPDYLRSHSALDANVPDRLLLPEIDYAQRTVAADLLGKPLYQALLSRVASNSAEGIWSELLALVQPLLLYWSLYYALPGLAIRMGYGGLFRQQGGAEQRAAESGEIQTLRQTYRQKGQRQAQEILAFLRERAAELPDYNPHTHRPTRSGLYLP